jgi:hypothetical protein
MPAMRDWIARMFLEAALGAMIGCSFGCAGSQGLPGESIEWRTGSKTGNPFEIRLKARGAKLEALLINRSSSKHLLLHDRILQASTLELVPPIGAPPKPYDSRLISKHDLKPYCHLFVPLRPGTKLELGTMSFQKSRDGYAGQWGPFNFDEIPAGDYQARVIWHNERAECFDEGTQRMQKLPSVWRGMVRSNQVTLHLP